MSIISPPEADGYERVDRGYVLLRRMTELPDLRVIVGGRDEGEPDEFKPSFWATRWGGECVFGLKYIDAGLTGREVDIVDGGGIRWRDSTGMEIRWFDRPASRLVPGWQDGAFEFDFLIPTLPPSGIGQNKFTFRVIKPNCTLLYQDPRSLGTFDPATLSSTAVAIPGVCDAATMFWESQEHYNMVSGSYAVYHSTKQHGKYKSGKICHMTVPTAIDATGKRVLCSFNDNADSSGFLTITIPPIWFRNAAFPVRIDPSVGWTTDGSVSQTITNYRNIALWNWPTTTGAGTITGAYVRCGVVSNTNTNEVVVGAYNKGATVADCNKLSEATVTSVTNTSISNVALAMSGTLASSTDYIATFAGYNTSASNLRIRGDTTTWGYVQVKTESSLSLPSTLTGYGSNSAFLGTAWFDYTTASTTRRVFVVS